MASRLQWLICDRGTYVDHLMAEACRDLENILLSAPAVVEKPPVKYSYSADERGLYVRFRCDFGPDIAEFEMHEIGNTDSVVLFCNVFTGTPRGGKNLRNIGIGQLMHKLRLRLARDAGYSFAQCFVHEANHVQHHILEKFGWAKFAVFPVSIFNYNIGLWGKTLNE